jgi:hypothetical protein
LRSILPGFAFSSTGVQFAAVEMLTQDFIHRLLPLHAALADELGADDQCFEMVAIAGNLQMFAGQTFGDDFARLVQGAS